MLRPVTDIRDAYYWIVHIAPIVYEYVIQLAPVVTTFLAFAAIIAGVRAGNFAKESDVVFELVRRYESLSRDRESLLEQVARRKIIDKQLSARIQKWAWRFWYLQLEQFLCWQRGLLNPSIYELWLDDRRRDLSEGNTPKSRFEKIAYIDGFESFCKEKGCQKNADIGRFKDFMDEVKEGKIGQALKKTRPRWRYRFGFFVRSSS